MEHHSQPRPYFFKHHFLSGLECRTKLFYNKNQYPGASGALPFIAHVRHNKQQLKKLARRRYSGGTLIEGSLEEAAQETKRLLKKNKTVLFEAVYISDGMVAKTPILLKNGDDIQAFCIQTRAFNPQKHRLENSSGQIYPKWQSYLLGMAYQLFLMQLSYPEWTVRPYLMLPDKKARASTDRLCLRLGESGKGFKFWKKPAIAREELFVTLDVSEQIHRIWEGKAFKGANSDRPFQEVLYELVHIYRSGKKQISDIGIKCKHCEFRINQEHTDGETKNGFRECWNQALDGDTDNSLVFDLIGPGTKKWVENGIYLQQNIPDSCIAGLKMITSSTGSITEKQRQALQIMQARGEEVPREIVKPQLFKELAKWDYPVHFLDFEAGNYAVPLRKGRKPYHLITFQFSCHSLQADGSWEHYQWIDGRDGAYPNYNLIRNLREIPDLMKGTMVQYSNFERNALKIIRKELLRFEEATDAPELIKWLEKIIHRSDSNHNRGPYLADLSRLVKKYYYNCEMKDSLSIKDIVQSVLTISPHLRERYAKPYNGSNFDSTTWWREKPSGVQSPYDIMLKFQENHGVRRGTEAMVRYGKLLVEMDDEDEREKAEASLLSYCELDTLAMLMIFQHWKFLMNQNGTRLA